MRKKFEVIQGGRNVEEVNWKFDKGTETKIIPNCKIVRETEKAWLIHPTAWVGDVQLSIWIPKSMCIVHTQSANKALHDIEIPDWMAKEKGLDDLS